MCDVCIGPKGRGYSGVQLRFSFIISKVYWFQNLGVFLINNVRLNLPRSSFRVLSCYVVC